MIGALRAWRSSLSRQRNIIFKFVGCENITLQRSGIVAADATRVSHGHRDWRSAPLFTFACFAFSRRWLEPAPLLRSLSWAIQ